MGILCCFLLVLSGFGCEGSPQPCTPRFYQGEICQDEEKFQVEIREDDPYLRICLTEEGKTGRTIVGTGLIGEEVSCHPFTEIVYGWHTYLLDHEGKLRFLEVGMSDQQIRQAFEELAEARKLLALALKNIRVPEKEVKGAPNP